jgi:hypothetical protein
VLSQANVKFKATTSGVDGEWVRDNQAFFPLWLAKLAGKHSTTSIYMLSGELEDLQFPTLYSLELNSLAFVEVHKSKNSPDLSPRLIEWLASCPKLYSLKLTIDSLREADNPAIKLLGKLDKIQHFEITLNLDQCDEQVDLTPLPKDIRAFVTIQELNPSRASQLRGIRSLRISTQSVSVNAVAQLSNLGVWLNGCKFDGDSASAISEISARGLILESCTFPERFVIASKSTVQRNLGSLSLSKTHIEPEMLTQWLSAANVTNIDLRLMLPEPLEQLAQRLRTIDTLHRATYSLDGSRTETIPLKP